MPQPTTTLVLKRLGLAGGESAETALKRLRQEGPRIWEDWVSRQFAASRRIADAEGRNRLRPVLAREVVDEVVR